jgi:hypothetical protein
MKRVLFLFAALMLWVAPAWAITVVQCTTKFDGLVTGQNSQALAAFGTQPTIGNDIVVLGTIVQVGGAGTGITGFTDNGSGGANLYSIDVAAPSINSNTLFTPIGRGHIGDTNAALVVTIQFTS